MKYLIAIATILFLIVILKAQGCGLRERRQKRIQDRQEHRQNKQEDRRQRINNRRQPPSPTIQPKRRRFDRKFRRQTTNLLEQSQVSISCLIFSDGND